MAVLKNEDRKYEKDIERKQRKSGKRDARLKMKTEKNNLALTSQSDHSRQIPWFDYSTFRRTGKVGSQDYHTKCKMVQISEEFQCVTLI